MSGTSVSVKVTPEDFASSWVGLWACLTPGTHSGYRLRSESEGSETKFSIKLDKIVAGTPTSLGTKAAIKFEEATEKIELVVKEGKVKAIIGGSTILEVADSTFRKGYVAIEGKGESRFGELGFTVNGVLLDDFERTENPLDNGSKWEKLSWDTTIGRCFNSTFGWVPNAAESGAYWTPEEFGEAEPAPELTTPGTQHSKVGKAITPLMIISTFTTEWKATGLPEGLSINESTGEITGTPAKVESSKVKLKVKGSGGTAEGEFEWVTEEAKGGVNRTSMIIG